jgi:hypothetical protein
LPEFFAGQHLTGAFEEHSQELKWLLRQPEIRPIPAKLPGFEIELKEAKANDVLGRRNRHSAPPAVAKTEFSTCMEDVYVVSIGMPGRGRSFYKCIQINGLAGDK